MFEEHQGLQQSSKKRSRRSRWDPDHREPVQTIIGISALNEMGKHWKFLSRGVSRSDIFLKDLSDCCMENRFEEGVERQNRQTCQKASDIIQAWTRVEIVEMLRNGQILEIFYKKKYDFLMDWMQDVEIKDDCKVFGLSNWKDEVCHQLQWEGYRGNKFCIC